jgi:cell division protein FtsB
MKLGKYLLVPWLTLAVYTAASMYNGATGIGPYRDLQQERDKMLVNLEKLQFINQQMEGTMDALLYDSETIRIKARELGYGAEDERFVRIVGLPGTRHSDLKPGIIRTASPPRYASDKAYRLLALCIGLLLFSLFLAGDILRKKDREQEIQGLSKTVYP